MRYKSSPAEFKVDHGKREITGYASIFGTRDLAGDVVHRGAFTKTLRERMPQKLIKYFGGHTEPLGMPIHAEEDSTGLLTVNRISAIPEGDKHLTLTEDGVYAHMSFAYDVIKSDNTKEANSDVTRNLRELKVYEWGGVIWSCHEDAVVLAVKGLGGGEDRKGLYELADVLGCMARIRSLIEYSPKLTEEELQLAMQLLADMSETQDGIKALLEPAKATPMPEPPPTDTKAFQQLLAAVAARGSIHQAAARAA